MKAPVGPLAKLSRPRLHDTLPRERLYSRLDALRKHSVIWLSGPPGAGKTTLVAGYVEARNVSVLWYQVDAGDLDVSTFFYYLGEAAKRLSPDMPPLPLLTAEYLPDLAGFARRWFRQFFSCLPSPPLLVFDNYQEASGVALDSVLNTVLSDIPEGCTLVVISRTDPPAVCSRALAHGDMVVLGWNELKLTIEEAMAVARVKGVSSRDTVTAVLRECEGWAAGLTLMLERVRNTGSVNPVGNMGSMETVFGYFAGLVFDALTEATKRALVLCSYLPSVSGMQAEALTGNPDIYQLLDQFYRRHLFTNRHYETDPVYEFHSLFRTFLRAQAQRILAPVERSRALLDAAKLLLASGQASEAVTLYAETEDWDSLEGVILSQAPSLLAQGRGQTLRDWIELMPPMRLARSPWVQYWLGTALLPYDQQAARMTLTRAYERLLENGDFAGQVAAASGVVDTYFFSFSGYSGLKQWIDTLAQLLKQAARFSSPEQRLQACAGYLLATFFGDGAHPDIAFYVDEIRRLIREPLDPHLRLRAGTILISYAGAILHPSLVRDDLELLEGLSADPAVAPLRRAQWQIRYAYLCYEQGDFEIAEARLAHAERLCSEHGLRSPLSLLNQVTVYVLIAKGETQRAMRLLDCWKQLLSTDRPVEYSQWNIALLVALLESGERKREWPSIARETALQMDATGQTWIRLANRIPGAYALIECGEYETVRQWIADLRAIMNGTCFTRFERDALLIEADLALHENKPAVARNRIQHALQLTSEADIPLHRAQNARAFARLLSFSRRDKIEYQTAETLGVRYRLPLDPPEGDAPRFPVQVLTLGRFDVRKNGEAFAFTGKLQHRPLSLLKLLVAEGGRGVPLSAVAEAMWPDSEGDRAMNALKVALHRLRRLLGYESAITVRHGALFLDQQSCWTDVHAFEQHVDQAERHRLANDTKLFELHANEALTVYRGPFLPAEEPAPWVVSARSRFAQRARQLILTLGTHLESSGRTASACSLYESGLANDALSELLYQRLMKAHLNLNQYAEAMRVFQRCREMLSVVLGIPPSTESQALFRQAQNQARVADHP